MRYTPMTIKSFVIEGRVSVESRDAPGRTFRLDAEDDDDDNYDGHAKVNQEKCLEIETLKNELLQCKQEICRLDTHKVKLDLENKVRQEQALRAQPVLVRCMIPFCIRSPSCSLWDSEMSWDTSRKELSKKQAYWLSANDIASNASNTATPFECLCEDLRSACDREHTKVLELEAEVLKQQKMVIESEKRNSHLQKTHIDLQLKISNYKQCIDTSSASNAIFEINKLRDQLQGKDTTIRNLDAQINIMKVLNVGSTEGSCDQQALDTDRIQLQDTITSLRIQLDGLKLSALTSENTKLKALVHGKTSSGPSTSEKPKVLASGMYTKSSKYIPPPKRANWVKPTPLPKKKQVTFQEPPRTSNRPTQKPPVQQNKKPNVFVNLSTRTKPATESRNSQTYAKERHSEPSKHNVNTTKTAWRPKKVVGSVKPQWRPTGRHFGLFDTCPLTRIVEPIVEPLELTPSVSSSSKVTMISRSKGRTVADSIAERLTRPTAYKFKTDCSIIPVWNGPTPHHMITDPPPTDSAVVPAPREKLDSEFSEEENKLEMAYTQAKSILVQSFPPPTTSSGLPPTQGLMLRCMMVTLLLNQSEELHNKCTEPKRKMDSQYFKDKALLMEAKEKGDVLDAEAEAFLADIECTAPYDQPKALTTTNMKELSGDQAYWLSANEIASQASKPVKPATPFVHKSRPPSQVLASLQKVNAVFPQFEGIIKERTTQKPDYVSEWCFDYAKQFVEQQLVPFYDHFKKHIQAANDTFFKEIKEFEQIFDELEAEYEQCVLDNKNLTIEKKNLLIRNDCLIAECLEKDICSMSYFRLMLCPPSSNCLCEDLRSACDREHTKVFELEAEISNRNTITESEKHTSSASNAIFEINKLRQQLQGKDDTIRNLDAQINIMKVLNVGSTEGSCDQQALDTDRIQLKDTITSLRIQLYVLSAFTAENTKLKAQVTGTTSSGPSTSETPKVLAPGMYNLGSKYIPPPKRANWVKPTPLPKKRQVSFSEPPRPLLKPTQKPVVHPNKQTNVCVPMSTGVKPTSGASKTNGCSERRNRTLMEAARTMLIFAKAPLFLWAEAVATACYTLNRSLKADIGIFVGYAPTKKAYRIYNKRTRKIQETVHVAFDELTEGLTSVQTSSGLAPQQMTSVPNSTELELTALQSGRSRSALVKDPEPPSVPPTKKQVDDLFQWLDDDEVGYRYSVTESLLPHQIPLPDTSDSDVETLFDHVDSNVFDTYNAPETGSEASSSNSVNIDVTPNNQLLCAKWTQAHSTYKQALEHSCWIEAMQEEIHEFERLDVWILVPCPDNILIIPLKWIFKIKLDEYGDVLKNKARLVAKGYRQEAGLQVSQIPRLLIKPIQIFSGNLEKFGLTHAQPLTLQWRSRPTLMKIKGGKLIDPDTILWSKGRTVADSIAERLTRPTAYKFKTDCMILWNAEERDVVPPGYSYECSCLVFGLRPLVKWISINVLVQVWISQGIRGTSLSRAGKPVKKVLLMNLSDHRCSIHTVIIDPHGIRGILQGAVDWKSKKQTTIAMHATQSEYMAASEAAMEAVWIRKFVGDLGVMPSINKPINMYCDNSAAITFANEPGVMKGARHFLRRYHYVREQVESGEIKLIKVHTDKNLADAFTKALPRGKVNEHANGIGLRLASSFMHICD
ncbi:copia protein [Tanacetum coccineum]